MMTGHAALPPARTIRLIHASLITGVLLFALVAQFVMKPSMAAPGAVAPAVFRALVALALAACAAALVLRRRIPRRSTADSADLFWAMAATPALLMWAVLEGACLVSILLYGLTGAPVALVPAAVAVFMYLLLNPSRLDRA